jgi:hypothetical protein
MIRCVCPCGTILQISESFTHKSQLIDVLAQVIIPLPFSLFLPRNPHQARKPGDFDECIHFAHDDATATNVKVVLEWLEAHDEFESRNASDDVRRQFDKHYFLLNEAGKRDYDHAPMHTPAAKADILDARKDWFRWRPDSSGDEKRPQFAAAPRASFSRANFKNKDGSVGLPAVQPPRHRHHRELTV